MIARDRRIVTHHRVVTTTDAGPQEQDAPTIGTTREPHEELQIRTRRQGIGVVGSGSCFLELELELELELLGVGVLSRNPIGRRSYIPVFQIRIEKMKEAKRPPL
ncbi:hypothetical protein B296_00001142 [Ensete ventricosum]|uniref:Uncharacterized protein n=1 Tax=Ensete ventricosum TaxID=4639 RepID=A0A426Y5V9_ENSVE|nr:hypothetical protein B296_00001142 [Ensete ventricosum]